MLSLILLKKILSLYLILLAGAVLVRTGMLKEEAARVISVLTLYLISPCMILTTFQMEHTPELLSGMLLSVTAAAGMTLINILSARLLRRPLKLNKVEELSIGFPNVGNLVIPLVSAVLGAEWVVYTLGFIVVQNIMIWTYASALISGDKKVNWKKILLNPNIIAIAVSALLFAFDLKLPALVTDATGSVGDMIGPINMLMTGIVIGGMNLKRAFSDRRSWMASVFRLAVLPLLCLPFLKLLGKYYGHPDADMILMISMIGTASCSMSSVMQLSSINGEDTEQACAINVLSTLLCVITMPVVIYLYQL